MKLVISPEEFKAHGSYHFSYPLLVERHKKGEPLVQPKTTEEKQAEEKNRKKKVRKCGEDDYDIDDPFIDDAQVTAQFESIFQLMSGEGEEAIPQEINQELNFYVYRGPLQVDIIEKEFEPVKRKKKKAKKSNTRKVEKQVAKKKDIEGEKEKKKMEGEKEKKSVRKKREKSGEKLSTLTEQIMEMEEKMDTVILKTNPSTKKPSPIKNNNNNTPARKQYDTEKQVAQCEFNEALEEFSKQASAIIQFDPAKFPNALRPQLETVLLAHLRIDPNMNEWKDGLFETLATKVPYATGSLKKLALKKVLPMVLPGEEKLANSLQVVNNEARILVDAGKVTEGKAKFSEALREAIHTHVRLELTKHMIERILSVIEGNTMPSLNLQDIKRNAFRKIFEHWPNEQWKVSTGDISKEFSAYKRKLDQRTLKRNGIKLENIVINQPPDSTNLEKTLFSDDTLQPASAQLPVPIQISRTEPIMEDSFNSTTAVINETPQMMEE